MKEKCVIYGKFDPKKFKWFFSVLTCWLVLDWRARNSWLELSQAMSEPGKTVARAESSNGHVWTFQHQDFSNLYQNFRNLKAGLHKFFFGLLKSISWNIFHVLCCFFKQHKTSHNLLSNSCGLLDICQNRGVFCILRSASHHVGLIYLRREQAHLSYVTE